MALTQKQFDEIREHLDDCKNPLFLFDDDQDGLCSFLLLYRYKKEGKGVIVKTTPKIDRSFCRKVDEYQPDKIFVLDLAIVEQEFLDEAKVPVVWIDHHGPFERRNVKYYNPRVSNQADNHPTSYLCYQAVRQDIWLAAVGCVADWFMPPFINEVAQEFPQLVDNECKNPGDMIYNTKLGHLIRIFSFVLKGKTSDVMKSVKVLTRIKSPDEILEQSTEQGRFIYKRYEQVNKVYEPLLKDAMETASKAKDKLIIYNYKDDKTSFTSDLSNEAIYRYPDRIIIVAREKNDEMKCSIRSAKIKLPQLVEKALIGLEGYGGGHEHACGLNIKARDFDEFIRRFKEMI